MPRRRWWPIFRRQKFVRLAPLVQERAATLSEAASLVEFLFAPEFAIEDESFEKAISRDPDAGSILAEARERLESCAFEATSLKAEISELGETDGDASSARCRRRSGWLCSGAASACPCSSRSRCWAAPGRWSALTPRSCDWPRRDSESPSA